MLSFCYLVIFFFFFLLLICCLRVQSSLGCPHLVYAMGFFVLQHPPISQSSPRVRISPAVRKPDAAHTMRGSATAADAEARCGLSRAPRRCIRMEICVCL